MVRRHEYAQHFLRSQRLVAELIGHSNIRKNDTVYDLGAGSGIIASVLAPRCKQVIALEIEPQTLTLLRRNLEEFDNVTILDQDMLTLSPSTTPYKIFANIPFNLSASVVRKFTSEDHPPKSMFLIVQKQFARKLIPGDDHFTSQLSAELGPLFTVRIRKPLRRTDFTPPPGIDTVLLEIKLREEPLIPRKLMPSYRLFVEQSFHSQPFFQKTPRDRAGISSELRPSQLTLTQWATLFDHFTSGHSVKLK